MSKRILIVDDSKSARVILHRALQKYDMTVDALASGEEALKYLEHQRPQAIFLDHMMPGMDGFDALRQIKSQPHTRNIPVVMYTSKNETSYEDEARERGAVAVLRKNLQPMMLHRILDDIGLLNELSHAANDEVDLDHDSGSQPLLQMAQAAEQFSSTDVTAFRQEALHEEGRQREVLHQEDLQQEGLQREALKKIKSEHQQELQNLREELLQVCEENARLQQQQMSGWWQSESRRSWMALLLSLAALGLVVAGWLFNRPPAPLENARPKAAFMPEPARPEDLRVLASKPSKRQPALSEANRLAAVRLFNQEIGPFRFGQAPFSEERRQRIGNWLKLLSASGFSGTVTLAVHSGNFCVTRTQMGELRLLTQADPISSCEFYVEQMQLDTQSVQARLLTELPELNFELRVEQHFDDQPAIPYPPDLPDVTAADWNDIAAQNQRIEVSLEN